MSRYHLERRFNTEFKIERKQEVELPLGGYKEDWVPIHVFYGYIRPLTGKEIVIAQQLKRETSHKLYMPVLDFDATDRVTDGSQYYDILYPHNPNNLDEFLEIDVRWTDNG